MTRFLPYAALLVVLAPVPAQLPFQPRPLPPGGPQQGAPGQAQQPMPGQNPLLPLMQTGQDPRNQQQQPQNPLDRPFVQPQAPPGMGFPDFPPSLRWGGYPVPTGFLQPPQFPPGTLPPPLLPQAPDWPSWIRHKARYELPYEPDHAVVVRMAERVWYRTPDEPAFVPLYHFDKIRPLPGGSEVQIRQRGEFLLLLHEGSRVYSHGVTTMKLAQLDEKLLRMELQAFTSLELLVRERACELALPDGTTLVVPAGKELEGPAYFRLRRDETRASLFNGGHRTAVLRTALGEQPFEPARRTFLLMVPPEPAIAQTLSHPGVEVLRQDARLDCKGGPDGQVIWSGARIALPAGSTLRIDALQGQPFAPPPVPARSKG